MTEFSRKWLNLVLEYKDNPDVTFDLSQNDVRILLTYIEVLQSKIDKAIEYYETHQQECVIGRNRDDKLIKEYYLPARCSKRLYDILKEDK